MLMMSLNYYSLPGVYKQDLIQSGNLIFDKLTEALKISVNHEKFLLQLTQIL